MSSIFYDIFPHKKSIIIGAVHFPPLLGYPDFPGLDVALQYALADVRAFEDGGVDAVIIENNYDIPHNVSVGPETVASMTYLAAQIREQTKLPIGISVLWNDYQAAFSIAKATGLQFIRIPAFVDDAKTQYGVAVAQPEKVQQFRSRIGAERIGLFADIHVKHSEIISAYTIAESAQRAIKFGADSLIVTGKWTGDAPDVDKLNAVRIAAGDFPILCGSGIDSDNVRQLFSIADGAIVSTSLKDGVNDKTEVNVKPYAARIDVTKVHDLVAAARSI